MTDLCAYTWGWNRDDDRVPTARRDKFVGHVCGRTDSHIGRHVCLADRCRSWHEGTR